MILGDVMDEIAARIDTIAGLRAYGWPETSATPPAAIVTLPDDYPFDIAFERGMDRITLPVVVLVGKASDRSSRDLISVYCDGSGPKSIKAVVESSTYTALDSARVTGVEFDTYRSGGVDYLAAIFDIDIAGKGA